MTSVTNATAVQDWMLVFPCQAHTTVTFDMILQFLSAQIYNLKVPVDIQRKVYCEWRVTTEQSLQLT